jgi:hypothetical protein
MIGELTPSEEETPDKTIGYFKAADFMTEYLNGDTAAAEEVRQDVIGTMVANGKTEEEAEKSFAGTVRSDCKEQFMEGNLTETEAIDVLVNYGGKTKEEALSNVRNWAFARSNPDTYADDSWIAEYYEEIETSGIGIDTFIGYRNQVKDITGEGKKGRRMEVINSLPISAAQKDALYFAEGWAESKLDEAPWR